MKAVWTQETLKDLVAIYEYIAADSPTYASRMVDRFTRRSMEGAKL